MASAKGRTTPSRTTTRSSKTPTPPNPAAEAGGSPASPALGSPRHILYRLWNGVLPAKVCDAVIEEFTDDDFYEAHIQTHDGTSKVDPLTRNTHHTFIEPGHWTGSFVTHFAEQANLLWNLDVVGLGTLSILRYTEGSHFNWHVDVLAYDQSSYAHFPGRGVLERKLSVTVNLSDPADYDGGNLEFMNGTAQVYAQGEVRERGSVVVFPSTVGHRVTPITRGTRYALVGWLVGPPIR